MQDPSHAILVAGSGRSGTTWLGNILAATPGTRVIFEPLDRRRVPEASGLSLFTYARPGQSYPEFYSLVERILTGQVSNDWTNKEGVPLLYWRILVKEIRGTLALGWIDDQFHPKIVYITRHPCAVVASRVKLEWETHLDEMLDQSELVEDYLEPFLEVIQSATTECRRHAAMWAIQNLVPLRQLPEHEWCFVTYEQLVSHPVIESKAILDQLGMRTTMWTRRAIGRPSRVSREDSAIILGRDPLTAWRQELSKSDVSDILAIVRDFGIRLYSEDPMPHLELVDTGTRPDLRSA